MSPHLVLTLLMYTDTTSQLMNLFIALGTPQVILEQMKFSCKTLLATQKFFYNQDISVVKEWPKFIAAILEENYQLVLFVCYPGMATKYLPIANGFIGFRTVDR